MCACVVSAAKRGGDEICSSAKVSLLALASSVISLVISDHRYILPEERWGADVESHMIL